MSGIYRNSQYSNILAILPNPLTRIELPDGRGEWAARIPTERTDQPRQPVTEPGGPPANTPQKPD